MLDTILIILEQSALYIPLGIGAYISFSLMKVPNLSIESGYVFGAIFFSKMIYYLESIGADSILTLLLLVMFSFVGGAIVGLISSMLTSIGKLPHLLSSILTIGLFHGINQFFLKTPNVSISSYRNSLFLFERFSYFSELVTLMLISIIIIALAYQFLKTEVGICLAVYGNNPQFFQYNQISTKYIFTVGIVVSNALAGLSGYLVSQSNGFVDVNTGMGVSLFCITFLILGKVICMKSQKVFSILIPILGIIIYFTLQQILIKVGFNLKYFTMIQSCIVLTILIYKFRKKSINSQIDSLGV